MYVSRTVAARGAVNGMGPLPPGSGRDSAEGA